MILCIWLLTTPLVHMDLFLSPSPGPVLLSCALCYTPVLCCVMVRRAPRSRAGFHLYLVLCCVWRYAVYDMWRGYGDLKLSGVMLCYGAIDGRATIFSVPYAWFVFWKKTFDILDLHLLSVFPFRLWFRFIFCIFCFAYSVHISYWPPFFGGCVSCPQVQTHSSVIHQFRKPSSAVWSAPLISEPIFWYIFVRCICIYLFRGTAGPCPVIWFCLSV